MVTVVGLPGLLHTALTYRSTDELLGALTPLVGTWLSASDRVIVSLGPGRSDALRSELGADAGLVWWSDTSLRPPHPARRLRAFHEVAQREHRLGHGQVRFVSEHSFPAELPELVTEWERFDLVLDDALAGTPATVVCTFDLTAVPERVLEHVAGTHPMLGVDPAVASTEYRRSADFLEVPSVLSALPATASRLGGCVSPSQARALVRHVLGASGGHAAMRQGVDDLTVAVTELVTNAWQAGAESIDVWCWRSRGEMGVQVDDDGPGLRAPLAGYRPPLAGAAGGRGLWIVRQVADLTEIACDGRGTSVRARILEDRRRRLRAQGASEEDALGQLGAVLLADRSGARSRVDRLDMVAGRIGS